MTYKLVRDTETNEITTVNKITEGRILSIPMVDGNSDYEEYKEWINEGNEPEPADTPEEAE